MVVGFATYFLYRQIDSAVEKHVYTSHIKINHVGDFLADLLFNANFYTILAIVMTVLILSLVVFRGINSNFNRMEEVLAMMCVGDFSKPYQASSAFSEIGNIAELLEKARIDNQVRFEQIRITIDEIESAIDDSDDIGKVSTGRDKLNVILSEVSLS